MEEFERKKREWYESISREMEERSDFEEEHEGEREVREEERISFRGAREEKKEEESHEEEGEGADECVKQEIGEQERGEQERRIDSDGEELVEVVPGYWSIVEEKEGDGVGGGKKEPSTGGTFTVKLEEQEKMRQERREAREGRKEAQERKRCKRWSRWMAGRRMTGSKIEVWSKVPGHESEEVWREYEISSEPVGDALQVRAAHLGYPAHLVEVYINTEEVKRGLVRWGDEKRKEDASKGGAGSSGETDGEEVSDRSEFSYGGYEEYCEMECRCAVKCEGEWSDTPHGSHGYKCKAIYDLAQIAERAGVDFNEHNAGFEGGEKNRQSVSRWVEILEVPPDWTEKMVRMTLAQVVEVKQVQMAPGVALVEVGSAEAAQEVVERFNGLEFGKNQVRIRQVPVCKLE